jgi:hypothetical protein
MHGNVHELLQHYKSRLIAGGPGLKCQVEFESQIFIVVCIFPVAFNNQDGFIQRSFIPREFKESTVVRLFRFVFNPGAAIEKQTGLVGCFYKFFRNIHRQDYGEVSVGLEQFHASFNKIGKWELVVVAGFFPVNVYRP